jgi:acetyl esterase/lipase
MKKTKEVSPMKCETVVLNAERNVTLTIYLQDISPDKRVPAMRPGILVLPGGGYYRCSDREADPVALSYLQAGYHAFILRYSVAQHNAWPNPLDDYEQAMEYIRSHAQQWGLIDDKIAVIGFSAGGHLAACAATMSKNRPNAAILGYAVAGTDVWGCLPSAPDAIAAVDRNTCPCFLMHTRNDFTVPVDNSIRFMLELAKHDVAFESHIYAFGPHGYSTCDSSIQPHGDHLCDRVANWVPDSIGWLRDVFGELTANGMSHPICPMRMNGNGEATLSVTCTISHLLQHPQGKQALLEIAPNQPLDNPLYGKLRLCDLLRFGGFSQEKIDAVDHQLQKIENI